MIDLRFLNLRELIQIGQITINFYGLLYFLGFFCLYRIVKNNFEESKINKDLASDLMIYIIIGGLLGARIFSILFYDLDFYLTTPTKMLLIWEGGLSIHGGLFGGIIAAAIFFKKHNLDNENNLLKFFDKVSISLAIFLAIGRIINLLNGEIAGSHTNVSWCVLLSGIDGCRHPVQIYAFLKDISIVIFLLKIKKVSKSPGLLTSYFLVLYGLLRFIIDFYREYPTYYMGLGVGQYLSLLLIIMGIITMIKNK